MSCVSLVALWTSVVVGSSRTGTVTTAERTMRFYSARRTLHTGAGLLTNRAHQRPVDLFKPDEHVELEATWGATSE